MLLVPLGSVPRSAGQDVLVDDVHGCLLGRRRRTVDAHVHGDQRALLVLVRALVGGHEPAGAGGADLVVQEFPVGALAVPETVTVRGDGLRQLLGEPLVQRLAPLR
jgi:hypothetical protein